MSKFRLEVDVAFENESDAIALKNYIDTNRVKAYSPTGLEPIALFRKCKKSLESYDGKDPTQESTVDFGTV